MKTKPVENILPIPLESESQQIMNIYHEAIHEMVCYGTHLLAGSMKANKLKGTATEIDMAPSLLFRHILELLDAISVQLKFGIIAPCKVQLRAALESFFSLEYMLKEETHERAACFYVVDFYRKLNLYRKLSPGTPENASHEKELEASSLDYGDTLKFPQAHKFYLNMESLIEKPQYQDAKNEYLSRTQQNKKHQENVKWYSLYGGPSSLYRLAKELNRLELYEFLYKAWSNPTHGTELWSGTFAPGEEVGYGAIKQMRNMEEAQTITQLAILMGNLSFPVFTQKIVPKESVNVTRWMIQFSKNHDAKVKMNKLKFT